MNGLIEFLPEAMVLVSLVAIFIVLFVTILKILRQVAFFQGKTAVLISVALSVLFLVAFCMSLTVPREAYNATGSTTDVNVAPGYFLLLPWVALAVATAVVLSQVLLFASRVSPSEKSEAPAEEPEHSPVKHKFPGRPKKEQAGRKTTPPRPAGGKEKNEAKVSTPAEMSREQ